MKKTGTRLAGSHAFTTLSPNAASALTYEADHCNQGNDARYRQYEYQNRRCQSHNEMAEGLRSVIRIPSKLLGQVLCPGICLSQLGTHDMHRLLLHEH